MDLNIRQYLKFYSKYREGRRKLRKLFEIAKNENNINDIEFWLLTYTYAEDRMVENTCAKLGISKSTYHNYMNVALTKIEYTIKRYNQIWTF
jgi:predicted DNA-binding protein (UPF0251 family)